MKIAALTICLLLFLTAASDLTSKPSGAIQDKFDLGRKISDGHPSEILTGGAPGAGYAKVDSVYLMGGPDRDDGDFEDYYGSPSWEGWTSIDLTIPPEFLWNVSDFNCQNLEPGTIPNRAWWCGKTFESCDIDDDPRGYGHSYFERLDWYGEVSDPGSPVSVTVNAVINYDCEPFYDYLYLKYGTDEGMEIQSTWNGTANGVVVSETINLTAVDYVPHPDTGLPSVHLRWHFFSDPAYDQADCVFINEGAAQIDLIEVIFDQGTSVQMSFEDNEDPDPADNDWRPLLRPSVGDFAKVRPFLDNIDPCGGNHTPVVAFIDDGVVVPGTGGYGCNTWCYGPGGYVVNPEGGLAGPESHINNAIMSPVLEWPDLSFDGADLSFDVYRHEPLTLDSAGIFYVWSVRSTDSSFPNDIEDEPWVDQNMVYYGGPDWFRFQVDVSDLLKPHRQFVQVRLGVWEHGWVWGWNGTDASPAPYFDNVAVKSYQFEGPQITAREIHLFQDNFPANEGIDFLNLGNNSVRIDMAANIAPWNEMRNDPGDSMVIKVLPIRSGTELLGNPRMYYKFRPNALFEDSRDGSFTAEGYVEGEIVNFDGDYLTDRFAFDLPDTGWFFPGDCLHWYIEARDNGPFPGLTRLPADTTGFSLFPGDQGYVPLQYPSSYVVRALPSLKDNSPEDPVAPSILFWNDFADRGGEDEWLGALSSLGLTEGEGFDLYYTNGAFYGEGNGLGGRASGNQLNVYRTILYTCGDLKRYTLSNGDYTLDPGDDIQVLTDWLAHGLPDSGKSIFLTGDNIVSDLDEWGGGDGSEFLSKVLGVEFSDANVRPLINNQTVPLVQAEPLEDNIFVSLDDWGVNGGCPGYNTFDAVIANSGAQRLAEFAAPGADPGFYPYAAAISNVYGSFNKAVYLPYDFMYIVSPGGKILSTRALVLKDVLTHFGESTHECPPRFSMYVDLDATGLGDGTSWADAYQSLPEALLASRECSEVTQIWVAEGTYYPTDSTDREASFQLRDNLAVYGGFSGSETALGQRDWPANVTILSGDIGVPGDNTDNSFHVVSALYTNRTASLDGFTIRRGRANGGGGAARGGGMYILSASPTIDHVTFSNNFAAEWGGGIYNKYGSPLLTNVIISENTCGQKGGGMGTQFGNPTLTNGVIFGNNGYRGGGIYTDSDNLTLTNVTFSNNHAELWGGGMFIKYGAVVLVNTVFWYNLSIGNGPAIYNQQSDPIISYSLIQGCGGSGGGWNSSFGTDGGDNLDGNPLFVSTIGGDLHLTMGSPAIDAGYNNAPNLPSNDLDGYARIANGQVDMGAYEFDSYVSGTDDTVGDTIPLVKRLYRAYPNPFNPMTTIKFDLPKSERVGLRIFDISGRLVRILINYEVVSAGQKEVAWRGRDQAGRQVAAGVYFYRLEAGAFCETKRMTLVK